MRECKNHGFTEVHSYHEFTFINCFYLCGSSSQSMQSSFALVIFCAAACQQSCHLQAQLTLQVGSGDHILQPKQLEPCSVASDTYSRSGNQAATRFDDGCLNARWRPPWFRFPALNEKRPYSNKREVMSDRCLRVSRSDEGTPCCKMLAFGIENKQRRLTPCCNLLAKESKWIDLGLHIHDYGLSKHGCAVKKQECAWAMIAMKVFKSLLHVYIYTYILYIYIYIHIYIWIHPEDAHAQTTLWITS